MAVTLNVLTELQNRGVKDILIACVDGLKSHHEQIVTLGTIVDIKLWDVDDELAHKASIEIAQTMNSVNERWHAWHPSLLTQINQKLLAGETVQLDQDTFALIAKAKKLSQQSGGLFHPGLGNLIEMWGFHNDEQAKGPPPLMQQRRAWLEKNEAMDQLIIKNNSEQLSQGEMQLDLGGFAKGHAVDLAINRLKALGIA